MDATDLATRLLEPIPANHLIGLQVTSAEDGTGEVVLEAGSHVGNVIGSVHSSGLIALADAAGLAALISLVREPTEFDGVVPLGAAADLHFRAPARGRLVARCTLGRPAVSAVRALLDGDLDRVHVSTSANIFDAAETLVCVGRFQWSLRRQPVRSGT